MHTPMHTNVREVDEGKMRGERPFNMLVRSAVVG